jgi:hypothetical protein
MCVTSTHLIFLDLISLELDLVDHSGRAVFALSDTGIVGSNPI